MVLFNFFNIFQIAAFKCLLNPTSRYSKTVSVDFPQEGSQFALFLCNSQFFVKMWISFEIYKIKSGFCFLFLF